MMKKQPRIVFHIGGPAFHPVQIQASLIMQWLGPGFIWDMYEGRDAFERLDDCDLLVLMGMHWRGMAADWAGKLEYYPLQASHKRAFESYVASGRPLLIHHGAIASYDDWPRFGELLGFTWVWGVTSHSPLGAYQVHVLPTGHPIVANVSDYTIYDELYYNVQVTPGLEVAVHAETTWEGHAAPMVMTAEGGRVAGAGRVAYLANGHDMRAFACPALEKLWVNAVNWLLNRS